MLGIWAGPGFGAPNRALVMGDVGGFGRGFKNRNVGVSTPPPLRIQNRPFSSKVLKRLIARQFRADSCASEVLALELI